MTASQKNMSTQKNISTEEYVRYLKEEYKKGGEKGEYMDWVTNGRSIDEYVWQDDNVFEIPKRVKELNSYVPTGINAFIQIRTTGDRDMDETIKNIMQGHYPYHLVVVLGSLYTELTTNCDCFKEEIMWTFKEVKRGIMGRVIDDPVLRPHGDIIPSLKKIIKMMKVEEKSRKMSVAITHAETALLWLESQ